MSVFSWLGRTIGLTDHKFFAEWFSTGRNTTGKAVTETSALTVATAWACIKLLSQSTQVLPFMVYKKEADGSRVAQPNHPAYALIHDQPNVDMTGGEFWQVVTACIALRGNAYGFKLEGSQGRTVAIELIHPDLVMPHRDGAGGELRYRFTWRRKAYDVPRERMIHWRGFSMGGDMGLSAIAYGASTLGIAIAADDTAGRTFNGGGMTSGFITTPPGVTMTKPQREQFKESLHTFKDERQADPSGFFLLEGGFDVKTISINPDDLQLLMSRGFSVEETCRLFGVPPFMVGHTEKNTSWGSGLEVQLIRFVTFSLLPYLDAIQRRTNLGLLTPAERRQGFYTEFNLEGLLKADSTARANFYSVMVQNGLYVRDDIRTKENLPKLGGNAGKLTVQSNLILLDQLDKLAGDGGGGGSADARAVRQALRNWLDVQDPAPALPAPDAPAPAE